MLIIRQEQLEVLRQYTNRQFEEKVIDFLRHHFDDAREESRDELSSPVRKWIANARSYQFMTERQIMIYVTTVWLLGSHFDTQFSDVQEKLKSSEHSPDERAEWLAQWAKEKIGKSERS